MNSKKSCTEMYCEMCEKTTEHFKLCGSHFCKQCDDSKSNYPKLNNEIMFELTQKSLQNNTTLDEEVSNYLESNKS